MKNTGFKNPLILASVIALGISTALAAYQFFAYLSNRIDWITSSDNAAPVLAIIVAVFDFLCIVGPIVALLLIARNLKPRIVLAIYIFVVFAGIPFGLLVNTIYSAIANYPIDFGQMLGWYFNMNWADFQIPFNEKLSDFSNFFGFIALVLYVIGMLIKTSAKPGAAAPAPRFDPMTGEPIAQPVAAAPVINGAPVSNLPQTGFILAIFLPLVGVIISHIALNQMKLGLISNVNEKQAKNGLLIGYILMGVGLVLSVIFTIVAVVAAATAFNSYY
jgi:uncharacterized membrane protein YidH (DUF202 family)